MAIFTRTRRTVPPAPAPKAPVVAYSNPSASVAVWEGRNTCELVVRAEGRSESDPAMGQFTFDNRKCAVKAAQWLAYQNLTGVGTSVGPGLDWVQFVDAINDRRERGEREVLAAALATEVPELSDAVIQHVLEVHYQQVLTSKDGRRMWSRLLRDAATVERAAQIRKDAR